MFRFIRHSKSGVRVPKGAQNGYYLVSVGTYEFAYFTMSLLPSLAMTVHRVHPQYVIFDRYGFTMSHSSPTYGR